MDERIKGLFVEALRSGRFIQAFGCERIDKTYRADGVLLNFYEEDECVGYGELWILESKKFLTYRFNFDLGMGEKEGIQWFLLWSGMTELELDHLIRMNDVWRFSFDQIADFIELDERLIDWKYASKDFGLSRSRSSTG